MSFMEDYENAALEDKMQVIDAERRRVSLESPDDYVVFPVPIPIGGPSRVAVAGGQPGQITLKEVKIAWVVGSPGVIGADPEEDKGDSSFGPGTVGPRREPVPMAFPNYEVAADFACALNRARARRNLGL